MQGLLWTLGLTGLGIGLYALRRVFMLGQELKQLKRDQYYTGNRLKRVPDELQETVHPLRLQIATIAAGKPVSPELILAGRLYRDVTAEETQRTIEQQGGLVEGRVLLVDVRTPKEYAVKHAAGAKSVPFEDLEGRYQRDIPEMVEKIFVYCTGGERSRLACDFLARKGYTNVCNIQDGLQGWHGLTEGEGEVKFIDLQPRR